MPHTIAEPQSNATTTRVQDVTTQLDTIYRSIGRQIWAAFYAFCGDSERASDALQESFLRLQQQDVSSIRNPRSWLLRVGRNWLRDLARKKKHTSTSEGHLFDAPGSTESSAEKCQRAETRQIMRRGLDQLGELDRLTLILRYAMKWPSTRIAETLESTPEAIDMRLTRARSRLREVLLDLPNYADLVL